MNDSSLQYYHEELAHLQLLVQEFAAAHPDLAAQLKISPHSIEDPDISHLIQSVAYLTSRINRRLDLEAPEIANTLIHILYPHYLQPIPAMAILKINANTLQSPHHIAAGTHLMTHTPDNLPVYFRTAYPVSLLPLAIKNLSIQFSHAHQACLRITLTCSQPEISFAKLLTQPLRFFINSDFEKACMLYELIMNHTQHIEINDSASQLRQVMSAKIIRAVGFDAEAGLLPYPPQSFLGFRLLTEYFSFAEKFLFFDLDLSALDSSFQSEIIMTLHFNKYYPELAHLIHQDWLALGCTPIVNLFECTARPMALTHEQPEYHVIPDQSVPLNHIEVHSIRRAVTRSAGQQSISLLPFFGLKSHLTSAKTSQEKIYWHETRKFKELYIQIIGHLHATIHNTTPWSLHLDLLCSNRDAPSRLPRGVKTSDIVLWQHVDENIQHMQVISRITSPQYLAESEQILWKLVAHLSLNHLFLSHHDDGLDYLKNILALYQSDKQKNSISASLTHMNIKTFLMRHPHDMKFGLCPAQEVTLQFDDLLLSPPQTYLFGSVLSRVLTQYCSMHSLVQLILTSPQGELARWKPCLGQQPVL